MIKRTILIALILAVLSTGYVMITHSQNLATPIPDITDNSRGSNGNYKLPKYNENKSITYKKSYDALSKELLYARIVIFQNGSKKETICLIKDQKNLIQIVREFDKLKATMPIEEHELDRDKVVPYVVTMWREGTSVSYVIEQFDTEFYYHERPTTPLRPMPNKLVKLLGLNVKN